MVAGVIQDEFAHFPWTVANVFLYVMYVIVGLNYFFEAKICFINKCSKN